MLARLSMVHVMLSALMFCRMLQVNLNAGVNVIETYVAARMWLLNTALMVVLACAAAGHDLDGGFECAY